MTAPVFPPNVSHPFRKIVSHIRSALQGALVQTARCVYVSRTRGKHAHFDAKNDKLSYADM